MTAKTLCVVLCACGALACSSGKDAEPPMPPITYQEAPKPLSAVVTNHEPTAAEVPIAEDFDEESRAEINEDNFRGELDHLEAEITGDNAQ